MPLSLPVSYFSTLNLISLDIGAAYGTYRSGISIGSIGVTRPELIMKSILPVVMSGILGIYGMIVSIILLQKSKNSSKFCNKA